MVFLAHTFEEGHDAKEGVEFLIKTRAEWKDSSFGNHINWHLTLHYLGKCLILMVSSVPQKRQDWANQKRVLQD